MPGNRGPRGFGVFSNKKLRAWEAEFDARMKDPTVKKDVMKGFIFRGATNEPRVMDDEGTMRRRNGDGCCGCGQWSTEQEIPNWEGPVVKHHHAQESHHAEQAAEPKSWWARQRDK